MEIKVDERVRDIIAREGKDFRVCTTCGGAVILPVEAKIPKDSDHKISIGDQTLFISIVQAQHIEEVTEDMFYKSICSNF
ncbi:MAG: hypothetical protein GQ477_05905 [Nanohaloarchaea archaeon]|nr:hypothetical protein [Candidatus Nanohaloarchaea archaeon]